MIGWSAVVFGINSTCNAGRKVNSTRLRLVLFYSFLPALLVLLIPNTTADHPITYTNHTTYIFSMGATVQTECNIRRYCTLLGVILHIAKADIVLLMETVQRTINN